MVTPVQLGDVNSLVHDENVLPISPKNNSSTIGPSSPTTPKQFPLSPSNKQQHPQLSVVTGESLGLSTKSLFSADSSEDDATNTSSLVFSTGCSSDDNFSIDRYASNLGGSLESMEGQSAESNAKADPPIASETPRALNQMLEKFDLLKSSSIDEPQQDQMMAKFDMLQKSAIESPKVEPAVDSEVYRDKRLFEIMSMSPTNSQEGVEVEVHNAANEDDQVFASYSQSNSYSSNEMFADIEQFRSAESHFENESIAPISPEDKDTAASNNDSASFGPNVDSRTQKVFQQRIVALMNKVSELELEKDEMRAEKDDLRSKLNIQHEQDVQDMYENPYSNPFATPTKAKGGMPSFLEAATSNLSQQPSSVAPSASMGAISTTSTMENNTNTADLHRELTELRMKSQSLQTDLEASDRVKERLKKILKTVQTEDQQKVKLLNVMTKDLDETKAREALLKKELDESKIRIEGYELAQKQNSRDDGESNNEQASSSMPSSPLRSVRSATNTARKAFFSSSSEKDTNIQTGDVATALVVSQRQNEALEAFNKELEIQNTNLQKKCNALTEKYGLTAPRDGDAKGNQLYSRYLEMKSSLSGLSVVLEEAQDENSQLSKKVKELETEMQQQHQKPKKSGDDNNVAAIDSLRTIFNSSAEASSSSNAITAEQEAALKGLVEKLEVQILGYREAEDRHGEIRAQLEKEASELRHELEEEQAKKSSLTTTPELEHCYEEFKSKIANEKNCELEEELVSLKCVMDAAAAESTELLKKLERALKTTREDLRSERNRFVELSAKHDNLLKKITSGNNRVVFEENENLLNLVSYLKKETKELRSELDQKSLKIEKSEKRVAAKHEQALHLNESNVSLRDGIHKLKAHLSTISDQASKSEEKLVATKQELNVEREKYQKIQIAHGTLQTKLIVFQESIDGTHDKDSSKKIDLIASLAASTKELSLEKERVENLLEAKKELEFALDNTKEDLETQLHHKSKSNAELEEQITTLQEELRGTKLIVAAANLKVTELSELSQSDTKGSEKLQGLLESTRELLAAEKIKSDGLKTVKSTMENQLQTMKHNIEELQCTNVTLKEEMASLKKRSSTTEVPHQFSELEKLLATTQEELNEEEHNVESLEKQVDDLTMQIQVLEKCKSDLEISVDDVKQENKTVTDRNKELESLLESMAKDTVRSNVSEDNASTASTDIRMWESQMLLGNSKKELEDALKQNEKLLGKVKNLQSEVENSQQTNTQTLKECETHEAINKEMAENMQSLEIQLVSLTEKNESLLQRTAGLARRDQLQKASMRTSNGEIAKLMETVSNFQSRFESLAEQIERGNTEKEAQTKEFEGEESKWISKKIEMEECITELQKECEEIQNRYDKMDSKHIQTIAKKHSTWQTDRVGLMSRIALLEKQDNSIQEESSDSSPDAFYSLQPCSTDRSLLNQKVHELEQDIQLLDVTLDDKKQEYMNLTAELKETKIELEACEDKLEACEKDLESSNAQVHSLVLRSATDQASSEEKMRELEEELESASATMEAAKKERDTIHEEHGVTQSILEVSREDLKRCQDDLQDREMQIDENQEKMASELAVEIMKQQKMQSKYNACLKELKKCKTELIEKEEIMRELAKKQVEQKEDKVRRHGEGRNKEALGHLADELNQAHIRENALESMLTSCKTELFSCKNKIEHFESQVSEEKFGSGVYKDVIGKLNRSNDNLVAKNEKLKEETDALRASA
jgi:chromosome segregation ATPase